MELTLRPATPAERLYAYEQPGEIAGQCGSPGYLWGELDKDSSSTFFSGWVAFDRSLNTPEFKAESRSVQEMLRFDERYHHQLNNWTAMICCCVDNSQGLFRNGYEYVFRADTQDYSYLIRCTPIGEENHVHIYPYRRGLLDRHMKQAERGIRFITTAGKEKFRVADGDMVRVIIGEHRGVSTWPGILTTATPQSAAAFTISVSMRHTWSRLAGKRSQYDRACRKSVMPYCPAAMRSLPSGTVRPVIITRINTAMTALTCRPL